MSREGETIDANYFSIISHLSSWVDGFDRYFYRRAKRRDDVCLHLTDDCLDGCRLCA